VKYHDIVALSSVYLSTLVQNVAAELLDSEVECFPHNLLNIDKILRRVIREESVRRSRRAAMGEVAHRIDSVLFERLLECPH
jgi:hypothetical protein